MNLNRRWRKRITRMGPTLLGIVGLALFLGLWELVSTLRIIDPLLISGPSRVVAALVKLSDSGVLWSDLAVSLNELAIGLGASIVVGIPIGVAMGWNEWIEETLEPFVWFLYTAPVIAFYPLLIVWIGLGTPTIIALTILLSVFPIIVNTATGIQTVNPILIRAAKAYGALPRDLFLRVALPASLPITMAGLKLAAGRAMIGVIIGEFFGATKGLGFRISYAGATLNTDQMFAGLVTAVVIGLVLTQALGFLESRVDRWRT